MCTHHPRGTLFLPKTLRARDRITERRLRSVAKLVDWNAQMQLFRSRLAGNSELMSSCLQTEHALAVALNERTLRFCLDRLREMKPRTVWACHPVSFRILIHYQATEIAQFHHPVLTRIDLR